MDKSKSIKNKILAMVSLTALIICLGVTIAGSVMIYVATEESIRSEVEHASLTMYNIYDKKHPGEYRIKQGSLYKGDDFLSNEEFRTSIKDIFYGDDVYFTLFWGDTRMFTSIKNEDGSFAVGTKADEKVSEHVFGTGTEYFSNNLKINGEGYVCCYYPISQDGEVVGMFFAGKTTKTARLNMNKMIGLFVLISAVILIAAVIICKGFTGKLVYSLLDIRKFMENVAKCMFNSELSYKTLKRDDEIGDIARSAETLKGNLQELIERDPLTSLLNRRSCRRIVENLRDEGKTYTAAMGDIDFFKKINDTYGHACGDMVLKRISVLLSDQLTKSGGYAARWGGEEFLMVFPLMHADKAAAILENLMDRIRNLNLEWEGQSVPVTMTIGISESVKNEKIDEAIDRADNLLYEGKHGGRNRIVY